MELTARMHSNADSRVVFGIVVVTLLIVAAAASFLPALRAARVDPAVALRAD